MPTVTNAMYVVRPFSPSWVGLTSLETNENTSAWANRLIQSPMIAVL